MGTQSKCECGQPRGLARTCKRCKYLDGAGPTQQRLIDLMRDRVRVSTVEVEVTLGLSNRHAVHILRALERNGRVRRDLADKGTGNGAATYALTTPRRMAA